MSGLPIHYKLFFETLQNSIYCAGASGVAGCLAEWLGQLGGKLAAPLSQEGFSSKRGGESGWEVRRAGRVGTAKEVGGENELGMIL